MSYVANGIYDMVGTFNGNPLAVAASRAMLDEVATDEAYEQIGAPPPGNDRHRACDRRGRPARPRRVGWGEGLCHLLDRARHDYRDFLEIDDRYNHAHWLFQHNGGVFLPGARPSSGSSRSSNT